MVQQHVDDTLETVGLPGGEEAAADLVHGLPQLGQGVVVLPGVVPVGRWQPHGQTLGPFVPQAQDSQGG